MIRSLVLVLSMLASMAFAVEPDEVLDDPALEARARAISENVRCVVCQNEPIDSSNATIARDLRILIRERLVAGDTDEEVNAFLVERYGAFVLFTPPVTGSTVGLWIGPFVILGIAMIGGWVAVRRHLGKADALSAEEIQAADEILKGED